MYTKKLNLFIGFFIFCFIVFIFRAYQLAKYPTLPISLISPVEEIRRGTIYDSLNHELAISLDTVSVAIRPAEIVNRKQTVFLLAQALNMPEAEIIEKIDSDTRFVWLKRKISLDSVKELKQLKVPGLILKKEASRYYPNKRLAANIIGFTGIDNEGLAGIEYQYNDELTKSSDTFYAGNNVYLTINSYIQYQLERALHDGLIASKSRAAVGVISNVHNGKILAMASLPDFDPNHPLDFPESSRRNRAISENLEPGSTFKIFTLTSVMSENMLERGATYFCPGFFEYKGIKLHCTHSHQKQTVMDILKNSCNTGMVEITWKLPVNKFYNHLRSFGFSMSTGIELPGEEKGFLPAPAQWDIYRKMSIPIGHGLSVTPVQMIAAANSIANGGNLLKPTIIEKVTSSEGEILYGSKLENRFSPVSEEISKEMLSYLQHVVSKGGTGFLAAVPEFSVAGKTGTAMKSTAHGYNPDKYQASFLGFFPGNQPEIAVFVWYDEPGEETYHGGTVAAPVFKNILLDIIPIIYRGTQNKIGVLDHYQYDTIKYDGKHMPDFRGRGKKEVMRFIWEKLPGEHKVSGKGYLYSQNPPPGAQLASPYHFQLSFKEKIE